MMETRSLVVRWETRGTVLRVEFLDPRSRLAISHAREWHDKATLIGHVSRSLTPANNGPRGALFQRQVEVGKGEIELMVTREQYDKLKTKGPWDAGH